MSDSISDIVGEVRDTYNRIGVHFSRTRNFVWPEMKPYLENLEDGARVLDLGCGNGRLLLGIKSKIKYLGIDNSKTLLDEARRIHPNESFVEGDLTQGNFWSSLGNFDVIFLVAVMHHIPSRCSQLKILTRCKDKLNQDGRLYLSVWNLWQFNYWKYHFQSLLSKLSNWRYVYIPFQKTEKRFCIAMGEKYIKNLVLEAGFTIEKIECVDNKGNKSNWRTGRNVVVVARISRET